MAVDRTRKPATTHRWKFFRAGGVDQPRIETGADLLAIGELDQKLWVALGCPVKGLEFDERTLALIDTDGDGRVRAPEMIAAAKWAASLLRDPEVLTEPEGGLPLAAIDDRTPEGKKILASAKHVLAGLGRGEADRITVEDTTKTVELFQQMKFNGDGVVPPEAVDDAAARQVAAEIVACLGGEPDRSGKPGISAAKIDAFFAELAAFDAWQREAESAKARVLPLDGGTAAAAEAVRGVRVKVDDYFARCRLAAYDARSLAAVNRREEEYLAVLARDMSLTAQEVAGFPVAKVEAGRPLPLADAVNPAWAGAVAKFREATVAPILGREKTTLSEAEWGTIAERLAGYEAWREGRKGAAVEKLGLARVREILASKSREILTKLVEKDKSVAGEVEAIGAVERLARYHRDLLVLANNFVSFADFYSRRRKAVFQAGTLYLDGRSCDLCVRVGDAGSHSVMAIMGKTYLAYCECTRPASGEKMTIGAAFTAGDSDNLMVGRNGLFYDRSGRDWDATVVKIVENPISIGQAFWAPYKRVLRFIEESVAKRAAAADAAASETLTSAATTAGEAASTGKAPAAKPKMDIGVVAAIGVAVGGITAALTGLLDSFLGLGPWMPVGVISLILLISGPSMLIAWLKLRQRNLGPILDANGWAVNGRVKVNIPLGASLTATAVLPPGAERSLTDPYAPKKSLWPKVLVFFVVMGLVGWALWEAGPGQEWWHRFWYWTRQQLGWGV